ncbi:PEP-CTERM sorting domain-containing protein [Paucibacter sp. PLA-PC-4]|uniref:PEP-CTERM sorting domain-containing protein n=1 Tax=Paucibacter sp. PLA-PC-4 TaxID=2993655 RepID=UPI00224AA925|nr:PEP-CTERM sorting domain-containing protein [Paucibacter sp. PLA-PC-4]MCX2864923.1 PEP-CTERM sorting domain-containing protein [Paucibacter sp. PLA-PC-4]
MKRLLAICTCALAIAAATAPDSHAAGYQFDLPDIGKFDDFIAEDGSATFTGNGFVGMYNDRWSHHGITWSHALDLNNANDGRTLMQVNLAPLQGQQIVSATLSFKILDGQDAPNTALVRFTGFDNGVGNLGMAWDAPATSLGSVEHEVFNGSPDSQAFDITSLLRLGVASGGDWMGLHLQNLGGGQLATRTYEFLLDEQIAMLEPDRAQVRINVVTAPVPEPTSWAMLLAGIAALAWTRRRRSSAAAVI